MQLPAKAQRPFTQLAHTICQCIQCSHLQRHSNQPAEQRNQYSTRGQGRVPANQVQAKSAEVKKRLW